MNTVQIFLCVGLGIVITWVIGSMAADAWWAFNHRTRTIIKYGTAHWHQPVAAYQPGELPTAYTAH